ncbi:MAG: hypothetical protein M1819_004292 [Sarea resinae]|nr:MAG: hypothetical protein M1819_004292 [Sarea resinae]
MADQILDKLREAFEGQIDFEGQRLADLLATFLLAGTGLIAFIVGYILQDIRLSLYMGLAGTALTCLAVVPPWPYFNKHPVHWLPADNGLTGTRIMVDMKT